MKGGINYLNDFFKGFGSLLININEEVENAEPEYYLMDFVCPITTDVMVDPVVTADGHTYERRAIKMWLAQNNTSPKTNQPLVDKTIRPNITLRNAIESFKKLMDKLKLVDEEVDDEITGTENALDFARNQLIKIEKRQKLKPRLQNFTRSRTAPPVTLRSPLPRPRFIKSRTAPPGTLRNIPTIQYL